MTYDPIDFSFQVHNDATRTETAYLCPEGLPWGATLEVTPAQADIPPGKAAIFSCRLTLDPQVIRPGCANDQGFQLTTWRVADEADQRWGSCFYFLRPRVRTRLEILGGSWTEKQFSVRGRLSLDTDQPVSLADHLPLQVRVRLEGDIAAEPAWVTAAVGPGGVFAVQRELSGPEGGRLRVQAWFDRTDLLASSRSGILECLHQTIPVIN